MDVLQTKTQILDRDTVRRKIARMALEVAEQTIGQESLLIAGVNGNGEMVAKLLAGELQRLLPVPVEIITVQIDKKELGFVSLSVAAHLDDRAILLVDDVANTGRTLFYALKPFLEAKPKRLQTAVLVERSHKQFPIQTDYTGLSIATTLQEHIAVEVDGEIITGASLY